MKKGHPIPAPRRHFLLAALALSSLAACGKREPRLQRLAAGSTVLALGDSLTQGVGADAASSWPTLLAGQTGWQVVNAGVSGDTSAQALARLPDLLAEHRPALVLVGIGGNDFLRQMSADAAKANIRRICQEAGDGGAQVVLIAVPQLSLLAAGTGRLKDHPLYAQLADELKLPLFAGGWSSVLSDAQLRADQVHANAEGYRAFSRALAEHLRALGLHAG